MSSGFNKATTFAKCCQCMWQQLHNGMWMLHAAHKKGGEGLSGHQRFLVETVQRHLMPAPSDGPSAADVVVSV